MLQATIAANDGSFHRRFYASYSNPHLLVHELEIVNDGDREAIYHIRHRTLYVADDITFTITSTSNSEHPTCKSGYVTLPEKNSGTQHVSLCYNPLPGVIRVPANSKFSKHFTMSLHRTADAAEALYDLASPPSFDEHVDAWSKVNSAATIVTGNHTMNEMINATLFNLRSSLRPDSLYPGSPGGLSTAGYFGLFFWDSELWIANSLLLLNPDLARTVTTYRLNHLDQSFKHARSNGNVGCQIPWQTGLTGGDASLAPFANLKEIHNSGDTSLFLEFVHSSSGNLTWLGEMSELVFCLADYWEERVVNGSISGVVGPDEFAKGKFYRGVTDNPYTNLVARRSLEFAVMTRDLLGLSANTGWQEAASSIKILFDENLRVHPEYDGFPNAQSKEGVVKQADVTMMNHPLGYDYPEGNDVLRNDLLYCESMYDKNGPAMTHSVHTIGWCSLGEAERCRSAFDQGNRNQQPQFGIWTETVDPEYHPNDMGSYNFLTGAGGGLQAIVHGYFGLKVRGNTLEGRVTWDANLFGGMLAMHGVKWRGVTFDILADGTSTTVQVTHGCSVVSGVEVCEGGNWTSNIAKGFTIDDSP